MSTTTSHTCNKLCLTAVDDAKLWHLKLGHLPIKQLKLINPSYNVKSYVKDIICQVYPQAKTNQTLLPY